MYDREVFGNQKVNNSEGMPQALLYPRVVRQLSPATCTLSCNDSPRPKCAAFCLVKVCVSAVDPALFPACVEAGAEMIELGNFDCFYDQVIRRLRLCPVLPCFSFAAAYGTPRWVLLMPCTSNERRKKTTYSAMTRLVCR